MPNTNLRLPPTPSPAFDSEIGSLSRSQSQNFPYNAINGGTQIILPTSHSVNDNLASVGTATSEIRTEDPLSKSPKSGRVHCIPHKWEQKRHSKICRCFGCAKQITFLSACQKCSVCRVRVHENCKSKVGNTCGLTAKHLRACIEHMVTSGNDWGTDDFPSNIADLNNQHRSSSRGELIESSASNSANSSTPSTPEVAPKTAPPVTTMSSSPNQYESLFKFPDSTPNVPSIVLPSSTDDNMNESCPIIDSDHTIKFGSGDESDQNTLHNESFDSGTTEDSKGHKWDRHAWSKYTIRDKSSSTLKEDLIIPFDKVTVKRSIGRGRFGEVFACDHFGDAAVKFLNMNHNSSTDNHFEAFLREVREVKLARHDRILAFFGCTMDATTNMMGIVVGYCEGKPLHTLLHQRDSFVKIDFQKVVRLSSQICQGMSYLHNRKLLHKDLRSKNIFITQNNNVVISDYSLFNVKMLAKPSRTNTIIVPDNWLCYLAPELIRNLATDFRSLPFSEQSDVYAFGTILYEFIAHDFPFARQSSDATIWQVGVGIKPVLGNMNVSREAKVLLVRCWMHNPDDRPSFTEILKLVEKLPMKHLGRCPSNPLC
uniref:Kinase suppressor of Ras 2 n=1 Tax=Panagrolaimus sp. JU765 TaxID=591449 RepID=A0AC34Q6D8_9BILA